MSWGGIDLIPRRSGESPQDAVARVYAGGLQITISDGVPVVEYIAPATDGEGAPESANTDWLFEAIELLESKMPGWTTDLPIDEEEAVAAVLQPIGHLRGQY